GIQADIKTFSALGVYGTSVLTAITAQNTRGVTAIENLSPAIIRAQIDAVLSDIAVGAIKIGMVSTVETIDTIAEALNRWQRKAVVDPV
ncbi:bifunctional hydroxymethylpyrimidine kinase/phosphomethylpyrimidine kinase, partial [Klebsiella pneumoniae]|uniref:bifunctional hydroxymethylpyrimidine kinase/phosphomethylpyrimidine kinase n=3 Tax=Pseudomonadota TaxID=1224 RepID=UPI001954F75D